MATATVVLKITPAELQIIQDAVVVWVDAVRVLGGSSPKARPNVELFDGIPSQGVHAGLALLNQLGLK